MAIKGHRQSALSRHHECRIPLPISVASLGAEASIMEPHSFMLVF
jgi:hypothetical protein